ncbi:MAG TPA: hypothetical protein VH143_27990 [Kofleriaceae bacterium]|nr:hypothetical protein [Kofleriaceae bacterium]
MRVYVGAIIVLAVASSAIAEPSHETVVVTTDDPMLRSELRDALLPADIAIVLADAPTPALVDVTSASRALVDREHATAAIWLIGGSGVSTLVTYDRGVDRVLVRTLAFTTPLDAAQSAEAARMARTMLRALRVTPDTNLPPPHPEEARVIRAAAVASTPLPAAEPHVAIAVGLGVRVNAPAATIAPGASAMVIWRPDALGVAIAGAYAPSASLTTSTFMGTVSDDSLSVLARLPFAVRRFRLSVMAGPALHITSLHGQVVDGDMPAITHYDPSARAVALGAYAIDPSVDVGLGVAADYVLDRQRYSFDTSEVLVIPRFELAAELMLTVRVW